MRKMTLKRSDGQVYLRRRGIRTDRYGVYYHNIDAPDPGYDLHNHPWVFYSFIISGGYTEQHIQERLAWRLATTGERGMYRTWKAGSWHKFPLNECHRIVDVEPGTRTLVFRGPVTRQWGFWTPNGFVPEFHYNADRRDLVVV